MKFSEVIKNYNICISNNPKGLDLYWPKSYAEFFYNKKLKYLYPKKRIIKILEINQFNEFKNVLWENYFKNVYIDYKIYLKKKDLENIKKIPKISKFDIIIINDYKNISSLEILLKELKVRLNFKGLIILENFHFNYFLALKLYFLHNCNIYDFRLKRFIIDNCIFIVYKDNKKYFSQLCIKRYINLIIFLITDLIYRSTNLILNKMRQYS